MFSLLWWRFCVTYNSLIIFNLCIRLPAFTENMESQFKLCCFEFLKLTSPIFSMLIAWRYHWRFTSCKYFTHKIVTVLSAHLKENDLFHKNDFWGIVQISVSYCVSHSDNYILAVIAVNLELLFYHFSTPCKSRANKINNNNI